MFTEEELDELKSTLLQYLHSLRTQQANFKQAKYQNIADYLEERIKNNTNILDKIIESQRGDS